jgi:hypothetical protein
MNATQICLWSGSTPQETRCKTSGPTSAAPRPAFRAAVRRAYANRRALPDRRHDLRLAPARFWSPARRIESGPVRVPESPPPPPQPPAD